MDSNHALTKRKAEEVALMPPPLLPKKIKRPAVVLDEDVYTDALSRIIARDFFPGLLESKAQQDYLDAVESRDKEWIREAGRNLTAAMTPMPYGDRRRNGTSIMRTPATVASTATPGATPMRNRPDPTPSRTPADAVDAGSSRPPNQPEVDISLSLQEFQAKYTSEDNASFNDVVDAQNAARVKKHIHLYNNTNNLPSTRLIAYRQHQKQIADTAQSQSQAVVLRPSQNLADRPASVDTFKPKQGMRNSFMFAPDSVEDAMPTIAERAQEQSLAPPKATVYGATRLPLPEAARPLVPPSPSMSAVDAAISGRPRYSASERASVAGDAYSGAETPMVNGYRFVDEEPTAAERAMFDKGAPVDEETVARLEREEADRLLPKLDKDSSGAKFKFSDTNRREELHHRMVDKNNEKTRSKMASRSTGQGDMTPAARSLASRLGTPLRGTESDIFGGKTPSRAWTPMRTPIVKKGMK